MSNERFEYLVHEVKLGFFRMAPDSAKLSEDLNRFGSQGWELATPISAAGKFPCHTTLIFKRAR
jgi:Domain of unknown function (DUF4177)